MAKEQSTSLVLPAPAKLNLFLHLRGRRRDGFHELQSFLQLLEYGDEVVLRRRQDEDIRLRVQGGEAPCRDDNLVVRAARALGAACGVSRGADILLRKRLPAGGGLGGGSSDAASTLLGLNQLWGTALSTGQLALIGRRLGADVPFFVRGRSAWAEGVGERLRPVTLPTRWYVVVYPGCPVATEEILQHPRLTRDSTRITMTAFLNGGRTTFRNDCGALVCKLYPVVAEALRWLASYGEARVTGTGACVFASFGDREQAQRVQAALPLPWSGFLARGVALSPLQRVIAGVQDAKAV